MLEFYQNLPSLIDPVAFQVGFFSVRWYAICYIAGFVFALGLAYWRIAKGESKGLFLKNGSSENEYGIVLDILTLGFFGAIIGGRLGYVLFYEPLYFWENPLAIFSPFNSVSGEYVGIFGMSYFGAIVGIFISSWIFLKRRGIDFWKTADFLIPLLAFSVFFGRMGNFINGELFGHRTDFFLGMYFSEKSFLRHPSQLYEAFFEGILLFLIFWKFRNKSAFSGQLILSYLMAYSFFRFVLEFFRNQESADIFFGNILTKGQAFSIILFLVSIFLYFQKSSKNVIIEK